MSYVINGKMLALQSRFLGIPSHHHSFNLNPMPNHSNARTYDFATTVEVAAAQLPVIPRTTAYQSNYGFTIRYAMPNLMAIELETTPTESEALARFIEAATADASSVNIHPLKPTLSARPTPPNTLPRWMNRPILF